MREQDKNEALDLPSIGLDTPKREIFDMFMHLGQRQNSSWRSGYWKLFNDYDTTSLALKAGIPIQETSALQRLSELFAETPNPDHANLYSFWNSLKEFDADLPYQEIAKGWRRCIAKMRNQSEAMGATLSYMYNTAPDVSAQDFQVQIAGLIKQMAQTVRHYLPPANKLAESKLDPDQNIIHNMRSLCHKAEESQCQHLVVDLDTYLLTALDIVDLEKAQIPIVEQLAYYIVLHNRLSDSEKQKRLQSLSKQVLALPPGEKQDKLLETLTRCHLLLGQLPQAVDHWMRITDDRNAELCDFAFFKWGAEHQKMDEVRALYPLFKARYKKANKHFKDSDWDHEIARMWIIAQEIIAPDISLLHEPEALSAATDEDAWMFLDTLVPLAQRFPQEKPFYEAVKRQLQKQIHQFNQGKLSADRACDVLKSVLLWKS